MNEFKKIGQLLLITITLFLIILTMFMLLNSSYILQKSIPPSAPYADKYSEIQVGTSDERVNTSSSSIIPETLYRIFKQPVSAEVESIHENIIEEVIIENTTRIKFLGYVNKEEDRLFLFKDTLYNDIFKISPKAPSRGFKLISIEDQKFTLTKDGETFIVLLK